MIIISTILGFLICEVQCIGGPSPWETKMPIPAKNNANGKHSVSDVQVAIIGSGAAGIAAATKLVENGIDNVVILEAQFIRGGRINTISFGDNFVDLGAQWVHGEKGNAVFQMAHPKNLIEKDIFTPAYIEPGGKLVKEDAANKLRDVLAGIADTAYEELHNYTGSLGQFFNKEYPKRLKQHSLQRSTLTGELLDWYEKDSNVDDASDSWLETSGRGYTEYRECEGHQEWGWKGEGYDKVLDLLMKNMTHKISIRKYHEAVKVVWDDLPEEKHKDRVLVKCRAGEAVFADFVIVTPSLGVLKENYQTMFDPALPNSKVNSIQGLAYGTVDKIILNFPNRWWPEKFNEIDILFEPDDKCKTEILVRNGTADYANCWDHFVYSFNEVRNQPTALQGWLYGAAARYMEQLPAYDVMTQTHKLLQDFAGKAFNVTVPKPTEYTRSEWYSNPHFRGSYSFRSMETEARGAFASHLAEPVLNKNGKPVLLFAGEATHSHYYSTVHGAIESGWREAERILKYLKKPAAAA